MATSQRSGLPRRHGRLRAVPTRPWEAPLTSPQTTGPHRLTSRRWGAVSLALLLVAVACLACGIDRSAAPDVRARAAPARSLVPPVVAPRDPFLREPVDVPTAQAPSPASSSTALPVSVRIPAIGIDTDLGSLGLRPDGSVEVPSDPEQPGWYDRGPAPGEDGSAVILGHVDSTAGAAVFFRLHTLQAGDLVHVLLSDGRTATFSVESVKTYLKADFPAQEVYASHGFSALQLVTCGGTFDHQTGHHRANVVVYSRLTAMTS
jgi:LPXTG-site transpeptidase (sortase) family protein